MILERHGSFTPCRLLYRLIFLVKYGDSRLRRQLNLLGHGLTVLH